MDIEKKALIGSVLIIIIVFASGILVYILTAVPDNSFSKVGTQEKLLINRAYIHGSAIFLDIQSSKQEIQLNHMVIKNATSGNKIFDIPISISILENQNKTISVNLDVSLASGTYTAALVSQKGGYFISPNFNIS